VRSREFAEVKVLERVLEEVTRDAEFLPEGPVGPDTTERAVEIPWMLSRYGGEHRVLDAGYAFASALYLSALLDLEIPSLHGVDRAVASVPGMTRIQGDLRRLPYRDKTFELVYCISTLEHVGRPNRRYGLRDESLDQTGDASALTELARVLAPEGRLLLSVPFGRAEDHGWLCQYDERRWRSLVEGSGLTVAEEQFFRLAPEGWVMEPDPGSMSDLSYADGAPAARGVACASLVKR
jgi:O-antigen chain-terminating methyltransferase